MTPLTHPRAAVQASSRAANPLKALAQFVGPENLSLIIALALLVALIASQTPFFFTPRNLLNIGQNLSVVGLISVGMTIVIVSQWPRYLGRARSPASPRSRPPSS